MPMAELHGLNGKKLKTREQKALSEAKETYADDILFYKMLQYLFFKQWWALKEYVNEKALRSSEMFQFMLQEILRMYGLIRLSSTWMRT